MGRQQKRGLDYFSLNTTMDTKIELIEASHGLVGYAVVVKQWQLIYGEDGYFYAMGNDEKLLFCKHNSLTIDQFDSILQECFKRGVFSREMYDQYGILTSAGIQRRYFDAAQKRTSIPVVKAYLLVSAPKNAIVSPDMSISDADSTQRKEEKSKEEDICGGSGARVRE